MNLHEFYIGIKSWTDDDLYGCLAAIDAKTDELYPMYHKEISKEECDEYLISAIGSAIEDYELMSNMIQRELENR